MSASAYTGAVLHCHQLAVRTNNVPSHSTERHFYVPVSTLVPLSLGIPNCNFHLFQLVNLLPKQLKFIEVIP